MNDVTLLLKSKPILFNTEMVGVILSDLKSETRVIKFEVEKIYCIL